VPFMLVHAGKKTGQKTN